MEEKKEYIECNDAENTTLDPKWGQWQKKVDITDLDSGWKSLTVATLGTRMTSRSQKALSNPDGKAQYCRGASLTPGW